MLRFSSNTRGEQTEPSNARCTSTLDPTDFWGAWKHADAFLADAEQM
jgi:hypothetical protein